MNFIIMATETDCNSSKLMQIDVFCHFYFEAKLKTSS